jgi:signal transduction histidine kinase
MWRTGRRSRVELGRTVLVWSGLGAFVVLVYVVVVLGGGALTGQTSSPSIALSIVATAVVALAFDPVQSRLERWATQAVGAGQPAPYDVLRQFSETVTGSHRAEELPSRMAHVLAEGTGAEWAQVWLARGDERILAATWPPGAVVPQPVHGSDGSRPPPRSLAVRHRGELLGDLVLQERPDAPLTPVEERLFSGLAEQAGLVLRGARLRAELARNAAELTRRAEELRLSRQRVVDAQDSERRRLERDIHDGAQQHLVALAVNLRLADTLSRQSPERAAALLEAQEDAAEVAIDTLTRTARGIFPRLLAEQGVVAALRAAVANSPVPVEVSAANQGRYAEEIETTAYFSSLEAVQNAVKHAGAHRIRVELRSGDGRLRVAVEDDGRGFEGPTSTGTGLANLQDRVDAVNGSLTTTSASQGTRVAIDLPIAADDNGDRKRRAGR